MKILLLLLFLINNSPAFSQEKIFFSGTHKRFIKSTNIIRFLSSKFQIHKRRMDGIDICESLDFPRHIILGTLLPQSGKRLVKKIEPSYMNWYHKCIKHFSIKKLSLSKKALQSNIYFQSEIRRKIKFIGPQVWNYLIKHIDNKIYIFSKTESKLIHPNYKQLTRYKWKNIPKEIQKSLVINLLYFYIGPDFILNDLKFIGEKSIIKTSPKNINELANFILSKNNKKETNSFTIETAIIKISTLILSVDTVLTY